MKKIIISISAVSILIFTGCYKGDDKATVRISFSNLPVAKNVQPKTFLDRIRSFFVKDAYAIPEGIIKIHVAAMQGDTVLAKDSIDVEYVQSVNGIDTVELEVPGGDNITILVVAENSYNEVGYYGYNKINLESGKTEDVSVNMEIPDWCEDACTHVIDIGSGCITRPVSWETPGVIAKYYIKNQDTEEFVYIDYQNQTELPTDTDYWLYIEFIPFNIKTEGFDFVIGGC